MKDVYSSDGDNGRENRAKERLLFQIDCLRFQVIHEKNLSDEDKFEVLSKLLKKIDNYENKFFGDYRQDEKDKLIELYLKLKDKIRYEKELEDKMQIDSSDPSSKEWEDEEKRREEDRY